MELALPVLVSIDERDRAEVRIPGHASPIFRGPSLAALLDDAALHLMEHLPKETARRMPTYELCPHVELRKVKVTVPLPGSESKKEARTWTGRLSVMLSRWPEDEFWVAIVPKLSDEELAVGLPATLDEALAEWIAGWLERIRVDDPDLAKARLDAAECARREHLEVLSVDAELPSILPSQPIRPKKRKKLTKKEREAKAKEEAEAERTKRKLVPPVALREVATNLTHRALDGRLSRAHLVDELVTDLATQLDRSGASVLLVGPSGVGKTAIVHEVVRRLAEASPKLQDRRDVWQVDGNRIIAGMSFVGAWEARVGAMVEELTLRQDILYVNDLPSLVYTGRSAHSDSNVAQFLEPHLQRGDLRIIGETTPERLLAARDEAPGFFARFRLLEVPERSEEETLLILVHQVRALARGEAVRVLPEALETILALTRRFEARRALPGKAVALLSRVVADRGATKADDLGRRVVDREKVIGAYARETGLPRFVLWEADARPMKALEEFFLRRIIAQPKAVEAALDVVSVLEQGLNDPTRPIATFLFVGPTGVGKTETAKALAELLFGSADRLVRFDMSELMSPGSVARLFGDRFRPHGELTRRIEQQPFSVVLLDEIEKAHPSVFDALLQVLGEGRMTNAGGRTVDFTSTVIVMTSNLGVREANSHLGFGEPTGEALDRHYTSAAERWFRPEFVNRIDRVVPFSPLGRDAIAPLVGRLLEQMLSRRGLRRQSVVVDVDPALVEVLVEAGFDPRYGARSIKRILEAKLAVPLARHLVSAIGGGLTIVELFPRGDGLDLAVTQPEERKVDGTIMRVEPVRDWADVIARHATLVQMLDRLESSDAVDELRREHSALVARTGYPSGEPLSHAEDDRLSLLAELLAELSPEAWVERSDGEGRTITEGMSIRFDLDQLARDLEVDRFEEHIVAVEGPFDRDMEHTKTIVATAARPIRVEHGALGSAERRKIEDLELQLASIAYRVRAAHEPEARPLLIRFEPVAREVQAGRFALELAEAFRESFREYAPQGRIFIRTDGGWKEDRPLERTPDAVRAAALEVRGPGLGPVVAPELGLWLDMTELGADLVTELVRVEEVGDGSPAEARLAALDRAEKIRRDRRRAEEEVAERPPLVVVRHLRQGAGVDLETELPVRRVGLGESLRRIALRRVFSTLTEEEA